MPKGKKKKSQSKNLVIKLTPSEQILEYRIKLTQDQLDELNHQKARIQGEVDYNRTKNLSLAEERDQYMNLCIAKLKHDPMQEEEHVSRSAVVEKLLALLEQTQLDENANQRIHDEISTTEEDTKKLLSQIEKWKEFGAVEKPKLENRVAYLNAELSEIKSSFAEMEKFVTEKFERDKNNDAIRAEDTVKQKRKLAFNEALDVLDSDTINELRDNAWLKKEVEVHERELERILTQVESLERQNLHYTALSTSCDLDQLSFAKVVVQSQVDAQEDLSSSTLLLNDLKQVIERSDMQIVSGKPVPPPLGLTDDYPEFLKLGPLEVKTLSVAGTSKPLHQESTATLEEILYKNKVAPDDLTYPTPHKLTSNIERDTYL